MLIKVNEHLTLVTETCEVCREKSSECLPYVIPHPDWPETGDYDQAFICLKCLRKLIGN